MIQRPSTLRAILAVARTEARSALRDRHVLIYSLVLPALLYPTMFWGISQISLLQDGLSQSRASRIGLRGIDPPSMLTDALEGSGEIEWSRVESQRELGETLDAILELEAAPPAEGGFRFRLLADRALDRSDLARRRLEEALEKTRTGLVAAAGKKRGLPEEALEPFELEEVNLASDAEMGRFVLGRILPMMIVIMAAMGAFYPAIETVVAERERGTLETLLLVPRARWELLAGKFVVVVASGLAAVVLNLAVLGLTARQTILSGEALRDLQFSIPYSALPLVGVLSILVCMLFSACFMILAVFARSFKEGQSYITPFYVLCFQPAILAALPGLSLTTGMALLPVANVAMAFREAMEGIYRWPQLGLVVGELVLLCAGAFWLAARILNRESVLMGQEPGRPMGEIWRILKGGAS